MIARPVDGGQVLVDRDLLADILNLSVASIRRHCVPAACDVATHRALYLVDAGDPRAASPTLASVARRAPRKGKRSAQRARVA